MGAQQSCLFGPLWGGGAWSSQREKRVLIVGLDAAGKTTMLYQLKLGEVVTTIPTIGFNVETVQHGRVRFTVWDVGGKDKIRPLWRHYYQNTDAIVYVVDSNDRDRIDEATDELKRFLAEDELKDAALLVMANKQDLPTAMGLAELAEKFDLASTTTSRTRRWNIQPTVATTGRGLHEGFNWLANALRDPATKPPPPLPRPAKPAVEVKAVAVEAAAPGGRVLKNKSYEVVRLTPEEQAPLRAALGAAKARLATDRESWDAAAKAKAKAKAHDDPVVRRKTLMNFAMDEAHWRRDRSQLRLTPCYRAWWARMMLPGRDDADDTGLVKCLVMGSAALARVASAYICSEGGGMTMTAAHVAQRSALDAFYYAGAASCAAHTDGCAVTVVFADRPGLEVLDGGVWRPLNLGPGEVAVLAGRGARAAGLHASPCYHRVTPSPNRASLTLDVYATTSDYLQNAAL